MAGAAQERGIIEGSLKGHRGRDKGQGGGVAAGISDEAEVLDRFRMLRGAYGQRDTLALAASRRIAKCNYPRRIDRPRLRATPSRPRAALAEHSHAREALPLEKEASRPAEASLSDIPLL